jgi:hypothetical protein
MDEAALSGGLDEKAAVVPVHRQTFILPDIELADDPLHGHPCGQLVSGRILT